MGERILHYYHHQLPSTIPSLTLPCNSHKISKVQTLKPANSSHHQWQRPRTRILPLTTRRMRVRPVLASSLPLPQQPLDLTEDNVRQVLADARVEFSQLFDDSVGITGQAELVELDGPFVTISLKGRFWHKRSTVVARLGNYLKQRIPEILEVDIEDEKQLDDSPENF